MPLYQSIRWFSAATLTLIFAAVLSNIANAGKPDIGGKIESVINGKIARLPLLKSDISIAIQGDLATVTLVQIFANPNDQPINATYLFPLNKNAAIHAMEMRVGNEIVTAQIREKQLAKRQFAKARRQGKTAALLTQHRPNMFTQKLANLMPGLPIKITLKYSQTVPKIDEAFELVVPLVVGPRYQPPRGKSLQPALDTPPALAAAPVTRQLHDSEPGPLIQRQATAPPNLEAKRHDANIGTWLIDKLPNYPEIFGLTIPDAIHKDRVSITISLTSALPVGAITSATHAIDVSRRENTYSIKLSSDRTIDNRDFVLRYTLAGQQTNAGVLAHKDRRGGFFSLLLTPPDTPKEAQVTARELVFILDTSSSMRGKPMLAAKTFMRHALKTLRAKDYFRIIRFGHSASEFANGALAATPNNLRAGQSFVSALHANGGTRYSTAIEKAFSRAPMAQTMRIVVFLSDGYIGNEAKVLKMIASLIGDTRIFAFGVGTSVNRYLMSELARRGRGFARYIDPTQSMEDAANKLADTLKSPVLTNIKIDWGKLAVRDVTPQLIPDLYAGSSIRIQGRYANGGRHNIAVHGLVNGRKARLPLSINLPDAPTAKTSAAIPLIWARSRVADAMRLLHTPAQLRQPARTDAQIKSEVLKLGLDYTLLTRWTSFIAVSTRIVNAAPQTARNLAVPLHKVKGVDQLAYPIKRQAGLQMHNSRGFTQNFNGNSTPEPSIIGGMGILALAGLYARHRRRRRRAAANA